MATPSFSSTSSRSFLSDGGRHTLSLSLVCVSSCMLVNTRWCSYNTDIDWRAWTTARSHTHTHTHTYTVARGKDDESVLGHLYALTVDRTLPVTRPAHRDSRPEALDRGFPFPVKDTTYPDYSLLGRSPFFPVPG